MKGDICAIIPCLNEERGVEDTILELRKFITHIFIIIVDNGSTDKTVEKANALHVDLILHQPARGKGNAVRTAIDSLPMNCQTVIMVDGDGTYDCSESMSAISMISNGFDMVIGNRKHDSPEAYRPGHNIGNFFFTKLLQKSFGIQIHDALSGWRVMSAPFLISFMNSRGGFELETELNVHAFSLKAPIANIEIGYNARGIDSSSKLHTFKDGLKILTSSIRLLLREKPFKSGLAISIVPCLTAIFLISRALNDYVNTGLVPKIPSLLIGVAMMFCTFLFVFLGAVFQNLRLNRLTQIQNIYRQSKRNLVAKLS